jgi:hypothetical protein
MLQYILGTIICDEFEKNIGGMQWKKHLDGEPMHCMEMTFKLHEVDHRDSLYPGAQLLIFGASNYIGVYFRESESRDEFDPWQHLSCHDSCWRSDGVDRFLSRYRDRMAVLGWHGGICNNQWYLKREVSLEEAVQLREITREARKPKPRG